MAGWFTRLFGSGNERPPVSVSPRIIASDGERAADAVVRPQTVLLDAPDTGLEVAEIKPMGVVVPKNRQELMEELRKNYADVIDLVRKVNTHLDDQASRQDAQDRRAEQVMQVANTIASTLGAIQQQNTRLAEILERIETGQGSVREAIVEHSRGSAEAAARTQGALEAVRNLAEQNAQLSQAVSQSIEGVGQHVVAVGDSAKQLVGIVEHDRHAARVTSVELLRRADQTRWLGLVAAIAGILLVGAAAAYMMMFRGG